MERKRWNAVTEPGTAQHLEIEEMSWEQQGRLRGRGRARKVGGIPEVCGILEIKWREFSQKKN